MKAEILLSVVLHAAGLVAVGYSVDQSPAPTAGEPFDGFVSYSIEFSSFPDFAGETTPSFAAHAVM
jgi:hypothetical protein